MVRRAMALRPLRAGDKDGMAKVLTMTEGVKFLPAKFLLLD